MLKAGTDTEPSRSNGAWIEAVVENGARSRIQGGALRIYFAGGAYCQISSGAEAALAAELLERDQPSDLLGGHAEKKFRLPDPFYRVP